LDARLPGFKHGLFFSVEENPPEAQGRRTGLFSRYPNDVNRVKNHKLTDLGRMPRGGNFFLWEEQDGTCVSVLPLNGRGCRGWVGNERGSGNVQFYASGFDSNYGFSSIPLALISFGNDVYPMVETSYECALELMDVQGRLRREKEYPEIFEFLGWCSWESYRKDIDEESLLKAAMVLEEGPTPIRYLLIDNGWLDLRNGNILYDFPVNAEKFPHGLEPVVEQIKAGGKIQWVGIWHTLLGYWGGIDPHGPLRQRLGEKIVETESGIFIPTPIGSGSFDYYNELHDYIRSEGFDFIKVDDQTKIGITATNLIPIDFAGRNIFRSLEASTRTHFEAVINCMAMGTQGAYHWSSSNIVRVSKD
jgi:hypothetical protein